MNRLRTAVLGRTTSYRLNAYDDADISDLLVQYVIQGIEPQGDQILEKRARNYIMQTKEDKHKERLMVKAYTLKWFNGYANLMWALYLERLFRVKPIWVSEAHYGANHETGKAKLFFWLFLLSRSLNPVINWSEKQGLPITLTPTEITQEIIEVQHGNTAENRICYEQVMTGKDVPTNPKVGIIRQQASEQKHAEVFLRAAAKTQIAAGKWDGAFTALLRLLF